MKETYLKKLSNLLDQYAIEKWEKEDILRDYDEMYDACQVKGMTDERIWKTLGFPEEIIDSLAEGYEKKEAILVSKERKKREKLTALSPFIALFLFFGLGFGFDLWQYSWMAFLLIPVIAIILNTDRKTETLIALSPFMAVIGYGVLGFGYDLWHPGWLVFLLIPVTAILLERNKKIFEIILALSPFITVAIFFLYITPNDMEETGWLVFLLIPMLGALFEETRKAIVIEAMIIGGATGYLLIGDEIGRYDYALVSFLPLVIYMTFASGIKFFQIPREYKIVSFLSAVAYVGIGLLSDFVGVNFWTWAWLLFLLFPCFAIYRETKGGARLIALSPFIALTLFYTLGYFFDWWIYSWMAFLLIPVIAIIESD